MRKNNRRNRSCRKQSFWSLRCLVRTHCLYYILRIHQSFYLFLANGSKHWPNYSTAVTDIDTSGIHALEDLLKALEKRKIQVKNQNWYLNYTATSCYHRNTRLRQNPCVPLTADPRESWTGSDPEAPVLEIHGAHRWRQDMPVGQRCRQEIFSKGRERLKKK